MLLFKGFFQPRLSLSSKLVPKYRRSFFTSFSCPSQKCKYRHSQNRRLTADRVVRRRQCTVCVTCRSTSALYMTTCRQHADVRCFVTRTRRQCHFQFYTS